MPLEKSLIEDVDEDAEVVTLAQRLEDMIYRKYRFVPPHHTLVLDVMMGHVRRVRINITLQKSKSTKGQKNG